MRLVNCVPSTSMLASANNMRAAGLLLTISPALPLLSEMVKMAFRVSRKLKSAAPPPLLPPPPLPGAPPPLPPVALAWSISRARLR